jgi:hypothetical protein
MSAEFNPLDWQLLYRFPERMHKKSSWTEHVPFAMALVEMLHPRTLVELGWATSTLTTTKNPSISICRNTIGDTKTSPPCFE